MRTMWTSSPLLTLCYEWINTFYDISWVFSLFEQKNEVILYQRYPDVLNNLCTFDRRRKMKNVLKKGLVKELTKYFWIKIHCSNPDLATNVCPYFFNIKYSLSTIFKTSGVSMSISVMSNKYIRDFLMLWIIYTYLT